MKKITANTLVLTFLLILLDQSTKYLAVKYLSISKNTGIAFGIPIPQSILILTTVVLLFVLLYFIQKELNFKKVFTQIVAACVFAGGLSNLGDRLYHGHVIDFITVPYWPSFNLADIFITGGILLLIVFYGKLKKAN